MTVGSGPARPKAFTDPWDAQGTPRPPTTIANPLGPAGRASAPSLAPTSIGPRFRRLEAGELAAVPRVDAAGGVDLSPGGGEVALAWDRSGTFEIYAAPLVGDRIIQLTAAGARSWAPRWSPDGRHVAFARTVDGATSLWLVDRDGDRERRVAEVGGPDMAWSPDGSRVAVSDGRALSVVDVASGSARSLGAGAAPEWSPDGSTILFAREGDLVLRSATTTDERAIVTRAAAGGACADARWSRDGSTIAFVIRAAARGAVAFALVRDGELVRVERLGPTPFDDSDPVWRPDGRAVVYRRHERGNVALRRVFTVSHADDAAIDLAGVFAGHRVAPDSESVAAVFASPRSGSDVVVRAKGAVELGWVTRSLPGEIDPVVLTDPVYVGAADGRAAALVYVPCAEAGLAGAVVIRSERPERGWDPLAQLLANRGHVVVVSAATAGAEAEQAAAILAGSGLRTPTPVRPVEALAPHGDRADRTAALSRV